MLLDHVESYPRHVNTETLWCNAAKVICTPKIIITIATYIPNVEKGCIPSMSHQSLQVGIIKLSVCDIRESEHILSFVQIRAAFFIGYNIYK